MPRGKANVTLEEEAGALSTEQGQEQAGTAQTEEVAEPRQATLEEVNAYMFRLAYPSAAKE